MNQSVNLAISALAGVGPTASPAGKPAETAGGFGEALDKLVDAVKSSGAEANKAVTSMIDGEGEVHDAMIALQRADLTFQFAVQVRNKLVQAYQDVMRMPV
jgi:flagellar hook-basal body complex protein FliE